MTKDGRLKATKTEEVRNVDLGTDLIRRLKGHISHTKAEAPRRGAGAPQWLFPNAVGRPLDPTKLRSAFQRILKKAKLPDFRAYDCRHTYANLMLAQRVPLTYVSQQLGHRDATTTLRYYAHWVWNGQSTFADLLDFSSEQPPAAMAAGDDLFGTKRWHQAGYGEEEESQVLRCLGGADGDRTLDLLTASLYSNLEPMSARIFSKDSQEDPPSCPAGGVIPDTRCAQR